MPLSMTSHLGSWVGATVAIFTNELSTITGYFAFNVDHRADRRIGIQPDNPSPGSISSSLCLKITKS